MYALLYFSVTAHTVAMYSVVGGYYFFTMFIGGVAVWQPLMFGLLGMAALSIAFCDYQYLTAKQ